MNTLLLRARALFRRVFFWLPGSVPRDEKAPEIGHDHVIAVTSPRKVPRLRQIRYASRVLSPTERRTVLVGILLFIFCGTAATAVLLRARMVRVPVVGGSMTEALVGEPRLISPVNAPANDVDQDIASLVYSGLFRMDGMTPVPDLAESATWSDDGKTLTVKIREDARFHNGNPVTAEDAQFTIDAIQDPSRSSPIAPLFRGVKAIASENRTIQFTLERPDASLPVALTVGILPASLWQDIPGPNARLADLNLRPIGSGPYRFKSFTRDSKGSIRSFTLERTEDYYGVSPFIKTLVFQFYPDRKQAEDALRADIVDALAFSSFPDLQQKTSARWHRIDLALPQETVAFFNLKNTLLRDEPIRRALAAVVDRQEVVEAWNGHAVAVTDPYPFATASSTPLTLDEARKQLETAGWLLPQNSNVRILTTKKNATSTIANASSTELAFTLLVTDQPELVAVANVLERRWSLLGARVTVEALPADALVRRVTRDRNHAVVVTNVLLGPDQDIMPFWWSGQAVDRGLNLSNLADRDVDAAFETLRTSTSTAGIETVRLRISTLIKRATPAVFLSRPSIPYFVSKSIQGVSESITISRPANRFDDLMHWYVKTGWRWK